MENSGIPVVSFSVLSFLLVPHLEDVGFPKRKIKEYFKINSK